MLDGPVSSAAPPSSSDSALLNKRKRRPAGTPDPEAEVVSLSPNTLLESDRYVCEICKQGFQRDQNLQMHRRRHKVPWKLLKRPEAQDQVRKKVFVCPERSCLHHHPCHALGDLVGIKKHFRRKHSNHKQWVCEKCCKGYAIQSDYKAHLKTCGTRGHSCDCGRVFSRVESFIEHQDTCTVKESSRPEPRTCTAASSSIPNNSSDSNINNRIPSFTGVPIPNPNIQPVFFISSDRNNNNNYHNYKLYPPSNTSCQQEEHNLELQFLPSSSSVQISRNSNDNHETHLKLSIGSHDDSHDIVGEKMKDINAEVTRWKELASEELKLAIAEKVYAEEARREAKRQIDMAELEFANARRIRQQAQAELEKAQILKEHATMKISPTTMRITCHVCKQQFQASTTVVLPPPPPSDEASLAMSSASTELGEREREIRVTHSNACYDHVLYTLFN